MPTGATKEEVMSGPDERTRRFGLDLLRQISCNYRGAWNISQLLLQAAKVRRAESSFAVASLKAAHASSDRNTATEPISKRLRFCEIARFLRERAQPNLGSMLVNARCAEASSRSRFSTVARATR